MKSFKNKISLKIIAGVLITAPPLLSGAQSLVLLAPTVSGAKVGTDAVDFMARSEIQSPYAGQSNLHFNVRLPYADLFEVSTAVDRIGQITDLGPISCANATNQYENLSPDRGYPTKVDRKARPMVWLEYSTGWNTMQRLPKSSAEVVNGHCYLMSQVNSDGRVVAMFHAKNHAPHVMTEIDEIEIFDLSYFRN
jgi:hypothetical protein